MSNATNTSSFRMLNEVVVTGPSGRNLTKESKRTFQATGQTTAGAGSATIDIEASNDGINFLVLGTITLTLGVPTTNDGFDTDAAWRYTRANVTAISGTGAAVSVWMGGR